jgi:hypothetical protein
MTDGILLYATSFAQVLIALVFVCVFCGFAIRSSAKDGHSFAPFALKPLREEF